MAQIFDIDGYYWVERQVFTVQDLIDELQKLKNKKSEVFVFGNDSEECNVDLMVYRGKVILC